MNCMFCNKKNIPQRTYHKCSGCDYDLHAFEYQQNTCDVYYVIIVYNNITYQIGWYIYKSTNLSTFQIFKYKLDEHSDYELIIELFDNKNITPTNIGKLLPVLLSFS